MGQCIANPSLTKTDWLQCWPLKVYGLKFDFAKIISIKPSNQVERAKHKQTYQTFDIAV